MSELIDFSNIMKLSIAEKRIKDNEKEELQRFSAELVSMASVARLKLAPVLTYIHETYSNIELSRNFILAKQEGVAEVFSKSLNQALKEQVKQMFF
jgi:hypothetical protein